MIAGVAQPDCLPISVGKPKESAGLKIQLPRVQISPPASISFSRAAVGCQELVLGIIKDRKLKVLSKSR